MEHRFRLKEWRLLKHLANLDSNWNLAIEDAIRLTVENQSVPNTLRFWKNWNTIVLGRFQCPRMEIDFDSCLKYKTNLSRRFTGGGTVYHDDGNLNFAISKYIHPDQKRTINPDTFFNQVGLVVVKALSTLGIHPEFKKRNIFIGNRKVAGLAGIVSKKSSFIHGSILVYSNLEILSQVLKSNKENTNSRFVPSVPSKVTTVKNEMGRQIEMKEMERMFLNAFEEEFGTLPNRGRLVKEEVILAEKLYKEKYSRPSWILLT